MNHGKNFSKKFIAVFLLISVISSFFTLVSCSSGKKDGAAEGTGGNDGDEAKEITVNSVKLGDVDISEYRIIYAGADNTLKRAKDKLKTEYEFDKIIATELADRIEAYIGTSIETAADSSAESEYEILIGDTKRDESAKYKNLANEKYAVEMNGKKLVINGAVYGNTYHALDILDDEIKTRAADGADVALPSDLSLKGSYHLTTIACVGDSITEGVGSSNSAYFSWPAVLQRLLWKDCLVMNLGNSGKTMRNDLADAYNKTTQYNQAIKSAANIDITLIMLGTNDSNRDRSWTAAASEVYNESCKSLVSLMADKNEDMKFFIMSCPIYGGSDNFGSAQVRALQKGLVDILNDEGYDTSFFDMYLFTRKSVTIKLFPDKLHPNDEGHAIMASGVAEMLTETINSFAVVSSDE